MSALGDRLRAALAAAGPRELILLEGDERDAPPGSDASALFPAAVLVAVTDRPEPGVILTQRADAMTRHAGQVAFPGGRIDPADDGPVGAALREAEEEIGLAPADVELIGALDLYRTITGFQVTPVLAVVPPDLALVPHDREVAAIFEVPLSHLLEPGNHVEQAIEWQGRERHYYEIRWEDRRIWGATAAMLVNLGRRLAWPS